MTWRSDQPDRGVVIRRITNYFTVHGRGRDYLCLPRARLKKEQIRIHVGDTVRLAEIDEANATAAIAEVLERRTMLRRPAIANVDQVLLVVSADRPAFNSQTLDRFLILVAQSGLESAIVVNKCDLAAAELIDSLIAPYRQAGYPVVTTSASQGDIGPLWELLLDKVTVLAGPSGVGKSSLLNVLHPGLELKANEVSAKIQRGRHTTTFASLYALTHQDREALVADTPGYSHLEFRDLPPQQLAWYFPEMAPHVPDCRFPDCLHRLEPDCAVKQRAAMAAGRYASYLRFLEELEAIEQRLASTSTKDEGAIKSKASAGGQQTRLIRLGAVARDDSRRMAKQKLAQYNPEEELPDQDEDAGP